MTELLEEIQQGLNELADKLKAENSSDLKHRTTERAKGQLQKAQVRSLVKGEIAKIDLIENQIGHAWSILHNDNGNKNVMLYYFAKREQKT